VGVGVVGNRVDEEDRQDLEAPPAQKVGLPRVRLDRVRDLHRGDARAFVFASGSALWSGIGTPGVQLLVLRFAFSECGRSSSMPGVVSMWVDLRCRQWGLGYALSLVYHR
jgi:hypothetical protein